MAAAAGEPLPVPQAASALVERRLARLPARTREALLVVAYEVTFGCAVDPAKSSARDRGHEDFELRAVVAQSALGGADAFALDDQCPRTVAPPGVVVPYPDGKIKDKGCGTRKADKTFGDPVRIDVADKR